MDSRIFPFWERKPLQELGDGLRQPVSTVRAQAMPAEALARALERAVQIPGQAPARQPWFGRRLVVPAAGLAASLVLGLGLWALLCLAPLTESDDRPGQEVAIGVSNGPSYADKDVRQVDATASTSLDRILDAPISPASSSVKSGSYHVVRRFLLERKQWPPRDVVRVAELVNSFSFDYAGPKDAQPAAMTITRLECPWNRQNYLVCVRVKVREIESENAGIQVARDLRCDVEFNPQFVAAYRPIDTENQFLATQAQRISQRQVTGLAAGLTGISFYEIQPVAKALLPSSEAVDGNTWLTSKLFGNDPTTISRKLIQQTLTGGVVKLAEAPEDVRFATAVAGFGLLLRNADQCGDMTIAGLRELAQKALGQDVDGRRAEFLKMVSSAEKLAGKP